MTHVRQQIREAAATAIIAADTDARSEVYSSLVYPTESQVLPLIHVHTDSEESDLVTLGGTIERIVTLTVTGVLDAGEADLDGDIDTLAAQIEAAIGGNTFSSAAKQTVLVGTEIERSAEGSRPTAAVSLNFAVTYHTDDADGETAL